MAAQSKLTAYNGRFGLSSVSSSRSSRQKAICDIVICLNECNFLCVSQHFWTERQQRHLLVSVNQLLRSSAMDTTLLLGSLFTKQTSKQTKTTTKVEKKKESVFVSLFTKQTKTTTKVEKKKKKESVFDSLFTKQTSKRAKTTTTTNGEEEKGICFSRVCVTLLPQTYDVTFPLKQTRRRLSRSLQHL